MARPDMFDDVQASYGRCLRNGHFIDRFYEILMDSHPAVRPMFQRTNFGHQRKALRRGISVAISFASGSESSRISMGQMAAVHGRTGRAPVDPGFHRYWLDSMIAAIAESDPRFTPQLEQRWRAAMQHTIDYFNSHYADQTA